jgi:hypothetical protein
MSLYEVVGGRFQLFVDGKRRIPLRFDAHGQIFELISVVMQEQNHFHAQVFISPIRGQFMGIKPGVYMADPLRHASTEVRRIHSLPLPELVHVDEDGNCKTLALTAKLRREYWNNYEPVVHEGIKYTPMTAVELMVNADDQGRNIYPAFAVYHRIGHLPTTFWVPSESYLESYLACESDGNQSGSTGESSDSPHESDFNQSGSAGESSDSPHESRSPTSEHKSSSPLAQPQKTRTRSGRAVQPKQPYSPPN